MSLAPPPLSLYLHFPWCVRKCPYCDFNSYTLHGELPEAAYLAALSHDMREQASAPQLAGRRLTTIFMGGGTPSLFSPAAIGRVLTEARALFGFEPDIEITLEANPGTIERGRFAEYAAVGVNRVSLGAQSFGARQLEVLGRIHGAADTARAAEELHAAGLSNFTSPTTT
jgi:coproporphyrinogen III oxidase-like Fe-S oxidoreductase